MAQKFGISERHLIDCMRLELGHIPAEMLRSTRMKHSVELLREGNMQIKEITYLTGYNHAANFTNAFKKHHDLPPRQYVAKSR